MGWKDLRKQIEDAASDLAHLKIETTVTRTDAAGARQPVVFLETEINQLDGDVKLAMSETVFTSDYGPQVQQIHKDHVELGASILMRNAEVVRALMGLVAEFDRGEA